MGREERENRFINLANKKHNNKYDYSLVKYFNNKEKVMIICPIHGKFEQEPSSHLKGNGCIKCANDNKRISKEIIIIKANEKHNNKYEYSKVLYKNISEKVIIICPIHGEFEQRFADHLQGRGCSKCGGTKTKKNEEFIKESNIIHDNKYNYSLVKYINNKEKVIIICPIHGEYQQSPNMHLKGFGCPDCKTRKSNITDYIKKAKNIHNDYYTYDNSNYIGSNEYITITCPIHGDFNQRAAGHLQGFGCSKCNKSKGEIKIEKYLKELNINYDTQKYFNGCNNINKLYFDFYLPKYELCIEYDGEFHYKNIFENNDITKQIGRDRIKDKYCIDNDIKLLRIPYTEFNNIEKIIHEKINMKKILYQSDPSGKFSRKDYLIKNHIELYNDIIIYADINNITDIPFKEIVYCYKHDMIPPLCKNPNCNKSVKFKNSTIGYIEYCSTKCVSTDPNIKKLKEENSLAKFGTRTPAQSDVIKNKIKKTNIELYGSTCPLGNEKIKQKAQDTLNKNYGVDHPSRSKEIQDKRISNFDTEQWRVEFENTMVEKYGVKHALHLDEFKTKLKNTCLSKHGVEHHMKAQEIKEKIINKKKENRRQRLIENDNIIDVDITNEIYTMRCDCNKNHDFKISYGLYQSRKQFANYFCTVCFPMYHNSVSQQENLLLTFIVDNYNNEIITNSKKTLYPQELDIYLPDLNLAIEFNGIYWHNELHKDKKYHIKKSDLCEEKGIQLIHIWEDDWVHNQDIIKSMILNKLGKNINRIFARKCVVKEITDSKIVTKFLNENHIQGKVGSAVKLGLYYEDELVSLMTFGKKRKFMNSSSGEGAYELLRFVNKKGYSVIGGASKLFKNFIKNYSPNEIITYADRSYSNGNLYKQLGFDFVHKTEPNYYYVINGIRKHRFGFRKDILVKEGFDPDKTEHEIMLERKIYRVYNAGNLKYIYRKKDND